MKIKIHATVLGYSIVKLAEMVTEKLKCPNKKEAVIKVLPDALEIYVQDTLDDLIYRISNNERNGDNDLEYLVGYIKTQIGG